MTLSDFQRIFFWEYVHRLLARGIGLAALLPWLYFVWRGRLSGAQRLRTALVPVGVAAQGALGWFMVRSGLVDAPAVSHFRLAAHLLLAFALAQWVLWLLLSDRRPAHTLRSERPSQYDEAFTMIIALIAWIQVLWGAFTAGRNAGIVFSTFPSMGGRYAPTYFVASLRETLFDPVAIHWTHRALGLLLTVAVVVLGVRATGWPWSVRRSVYALVVVVVVQVGLGAATVISHVHIAPAVLHQLVGLGVVSCCTWVLAGLSRQRRGHSWVQAPNQLPSKEEAS
jgi:cytochrome c oxidase assembly protein subunit 15